MPVDTAQPEHASEVVGVSIGSATAGQQVVVQRFGMASEILWSWTGGTLYCGPQGELTSTPAQTGWLLQVARILSPTQVDIDIEEPKMRRSAKRRVGKERVSQCRSRWSPYP